MCGFAGYINNFGTFDKEEVIRAMADRITHRGPDDAHYYVDEDIALGFRRLSIIDLEGGRQPILNEDLLSDGVTVAMIAEDQPLVYADAALLQAYIEAFADAYGEEQEPQQ